MDAITFTSEEAAAFKCEKCGRPVGAQFGPNGPWVPSDCHWCVYLPKARKDVARRRALGHVVAGVDLDKAFAAYRQVAPFKGNLGAIKFTVGHRVEGRWSGHAVPYRRKFRVAYGPGATPAEVLEVLMHEMCHMALPPRTMHNERFRLTLKRAAHELWGIDVPLLSGSDREAHSNAAYAMDSLIMAALEEKIACGEVELFKPEPKTKTPKPTRAELSEKMVEKRAAHTLKMLSRAEARAKAAQHTLTKWRKKARYYEQRAASKASKT